MEKGALKNTPRLHFYHQVLMLHPKIFNINQKSDFELHSKMLVKKKKKKGNNVIWRMDEIKFSYNGKFEGNILIVGRTGGKTTFVQNLAKNQLFGKIKQVHWISKIELSKDRENNIRDCFVNQDVNFDYPNNVEDFDYLLEVYKIRKDDYVKNDLGEKMVLNKLIVMDDVSGTC